MTELDANTLTYYRQFAEANLRFLDDIHQDVEFERDGGDIVYALDFSEVYGFSMGAADSFFYESKGSDAFAKNIGSDILIALHEAILEYVLFERTERAGYLLLPPYQIELGNHVRRLRQDLAKAVVKQTARAAESIRGLKDTPAYQDLLRLARTPDAADAHSPNGRLFRETFSQSVPTLADLWMQSHRDVPLDKVRRFLNRPYSLLFDVVGSNVAPDIHVTEYYFGELQQRRRDKESQNYIDAEALGFIFEANVRLTESRQRRRVRLISRSNQLYQLCARDHARWVVVGGNPVRHPRSFLNQITSLGTVSDRDDFDVKSHNIAWWRSTFTSMAADPSTKSTGSLTATEIVNRALAVLKDAWRRFCSAHITSRIISDEAIADDILFRSISSLNSDGEIQALLETVIRDIHKQLDKLHFSIPESVSSEGELGFFDRQFPPTSSTSKFPGKQKQSGHQVIVFNLHGTTLPYSIHIQDSRIRDIVLMHQEDPYLALAGLADATSSGGGSEMELYDAEWYLATGYLYASIGAWSSSLKSISLAAEQVGYLKLSQRETQECCMTELEIEYLRSRCLRELNWAIPIRKANADALMDLAGRLSDMEGTIDVQSYIARARTEVIKVWFEIRSTDENNVYIDSSRLKDEVTACKTLIEPLENDLVEVQFLNTICYHCVDNLDNFGALFSLDSLVEDFLRFCKRAGDMYGPPLRWPDNFLDTLCWVAFRLERVRRLDLQIINLDMQSIADLAGVNARKRHLSNHDRADFKRHYTEISEGWNVRITE